jgi:outer membrane protein assembly factor BamB
MWLLRFVVPVLIPEALVIGFFAVLGGALAVIVWWVFFSRAAWSERLGGIVLMAAAMFLTSRVVHESIAKGAMGMLFYVLAIPVVCLAFVAWAAATRNLPDGVRRTTMVAAVALGCATWTLVRTGGFTGDFKNDIHWRWTKTPEELLLAQPADAPAAPAAPAKVEAAPSVAAEAPAAAEPASAPTTVARAAAAKPVAVESRKAEWPGFRGPERDGAVRGARIETDWSAHPPVQIWKRAIGPGWSSFAVHGNVIYTQEQRGPEEVVASYRMDTGKPVWAHRDQARFWESNGGAGPRSTPTLGKGRVYTLGATGLLNALNEADGSVVWSRNAAADTGKKIPEWGFSGSPLLLGDLVVVATSGQMAAFDAETGAPRWTGPNAGASYSSPHLFTADGVAQILLLGGNKVVSVSPADGKQLWEHSWSGYPIVQPGLTAEGDVLVSVSESSGTRRLSVKQQSGGWKVDERWTTNGLKPYFNDFVVHKGHAYGFDGAILACIDLEDGKRKWKGGRYGHGQLVLLPEQDVLLVLSEDGELALVRATPDGYSELARKPGIEGKTWNHPVLVGDVLLARNGEEMAAFRLASAGR